MVTQWRVYRAGLDPTYGHEQAGVRPVIVVSANPINERYGVVSVIPVTSRKDERAARLGEVLLPSGTAGLKKDSFALCYQIRAIDKSRLFDSPGVIPDDLRVAITETLSKCLDLPNELTVKHPRVNE
jgi:mRNA interferase MazF